MAGPWEKYGSAGAAPPEEGPWTKYDVPVPQSGIPEGGSSAGQDVKGIGHAAGEFAKKAALPTAGSIALPAAMTAKFGPANRPFIPIEQGIGSGIGEGINQLTGITEPSLKQLGLATVAPIAAGYGMNVLRTGKALGKTLNTEAPQLATTQMRGYRSPVPAKDLFDAATAEGVTIPLPKTTAALQTVRNTIFDATPAGQKAFENVVRQTGLEDVVTTPSGISPSRMQYLLSDIGKLQSQASKEGGLKAYYLGKFYGALADDLEQGGPALQVARQAYKREAVINEVEEEIGKAMFIKKGQGLQGEFSANRVLNTLNKTDEGIGKFFSQSFSKSEQGEIKNLFGFLNELPSLQPGANQQFGSGRFFQRVTQATASGSVGAGVGFAMGGPAGAAVGAGVGMLAPEVANFGKLMLQAWKMPGGRQVVKGLLTNSDGAITPQATGALTAFLATGGSKKSTATSSGTMLTPFPNMGGPEKLQDYHEMLNP